MTVVILTLFIILLISVVAWIRALRIKLFGWIRGRITGTRALDRREDIEEIIKKRRYLHLVRKDLGNPKISDHGLLRYLRRRFPGLRVETKYKLHL